MSRIDETHDATLTSWVESANAPSTEFPIQNLPFGMFRRAARDEPIRPGVAIGDQIVDLLATEWRDLFAGCEGIGLNAFMARGRPARHEVRRGLSEALRSTSRGRSLPESALVAQSDAEMALPCRIGDYSDFYTGIHHATTVGKLFRPDNPLLPNYKWVPIGYHGRASSIGVSGQRFPRPRGQIKGPQFEVPALSPSRRLDYELELGVFVGPGNALGRPIAIDAAEDHVFGTALFNDWSARDVQAWEYQPLGPFLSKSFASTVSPWIVTLEALEPFRAPFARPEGDPAPLAYLDSPAQRERGAIAIAFSVWIETAAMRAAGQAPHCLSRSSYLDAYWTLAQMMAHHTVNGCNLQPGDLLGSGTISGPGAEQGGSLLELSQGGAKPIVLSNGETRTFLEDGDAIILRGHCERDGYRSIGFGACEGRVLEALPA